MDATLHFTIHAIPITASSGNSTTSFFYQPLNWSRNRTQQYTLRLQSTNTQLVQESNAACHTLCSLIKQLEDLKLEAGQPTKKARLEPVLESEQNIKVTDFGSDDNHFFTQRIHRVEKEINSLTTHIGKLNAAENRLWMTTKNYKKRLTHTQKVGTLRR